MKLVYILNGGYYGGADVGVGGERYPVVREGSRSVVEVPDVFAHLLAPSFVHEGVAETAMVERAAKEALARNAEEKEKAQQLRLARSGMLPYHDEHGNLINAEQMDVIDASLRAQEENQQLKQRLAALEHKLDMLVGSDKPKEAQPKK